MRGKVYRTKNNEENFHTCCPGEFLKHLDPVEINLSILCTSYFLTLIVGGVSKLSFRATSLLYKARVSSGIE